jgi:MOSC domain-containing protein YiiM
VGRIERIFLKRAKRGPMDSAARATLVAGRGIVGNANQGGTRQVTIIAAERWAELMQELGADLGPSARRANIVVSGVDLEESRGRTLRAGECRLLVRGETRPCEQMEDALPGLQDAMRRQWGGGAFAEIVAGGEIAVGDAIDWE